MVNTLENTNKKEEVTITESLFFTYYENREIKYRNLLVEKNLGLVKSVAYKFNRRNNNKYIIDDLIQVGSIGLIQAVERFNPFRGIKFSVFATEWINGEIMHYKRDKTQLIRIPAAKQDLYRKLAKTCKEKNIKYNEAAKGLGIDNFTANQLKILMKDEFLEFDNELYNNEDISEEEHCMMSVLEKITDEDKEVIVDYLAKTKKTGRSEKMSKRLKEAIKEASLVAKGNKKCVVCGSHSTECKEGKVNCNKCKNSYRDV